MGMLLGPRRIYKEPGKPGRPARTIPPGCHKDKRGVIYNETGILLLSSDRIKGSYEVKSGTKTISTYAFRNCKYLKEVILPEGLEEICASAFDHCGIEEITIPASVKRIEGWAFSNCYNLKTFNMKSEPEYFGDSVFANCSFNDTLLPFDNKGRRLVGNCLVEAKCECLPDEVSADWFPSKAKVIVTSCFNHIESLKSVELPDGIEIIEHAAFNNCNNLQSIKLPSTIKEMEKGAINGSAFLKIYVPAGMKPYFEQFFSDFQWKNIVELG